MKAVIVSLVFLFFISSCSESKVNYIIPEEEMIDILVDIHIADGVLKTETFSYENPQLRAENYYKNIFRKHSINRLIFDSALTQYTQDREKYISMYDKVIEKLRTKESYIQIEKNDTTINDSRKKLFNYYFQTDYEDKKNIAQIIKGTINDEKAKSGKKSYKANGKLYVEDYTHILSQPVEEIEFQMNFDILFENIPKQLPLIVFALKKEKKILAEQKIKIESFVKTKNVWNRVNVTVKLSLKTPEDQIKIQVYILNKKRKIFYLDDYSLKIKQIK
jgi:hypothetical protein